jgi:hypothetical protein
MYQCPACIIVLDFITLTILAKEKKQFIKIPHYGTTSAVSCYFLFLKFKYYLQDPLLKYSSFASFP